MANHPRQGNPQKFREKSNSISRQKPSTSPSTSQGINSELPDSSMMGPNHNIMSSLVCPVCCQLMQSPIVLCEVGHNVCNICSKNLKTSMCPICHGKMSVIRNYALENIINEVGVKCHNHNYGCSHISTAQKLEDHFDHCLFHQRFCPVGLILKTCSWHGNHNDLLRHTRESHPQNSLLRAGREIVFEDFLLTESQEDLQIVNVKEDLFVYYVKVDPEINTAYWAIQYVGDKSEKIIWKYEFTIYKSDEPVKRINVVDLCHSNTESISDLFESGKCVGIPINVLNNYVSPDNKFTFKFFIFKWSTRMVVSETQKKPAIE